MIITSDKAEGQKILAKLRNEERIWLTVPDLKQRMKFIPITEETDLSSFGEYVLCVINQKICPLCD